MSTTASAASLPRPGSLGAWIVAVRPKTLTAGAVPVAVGTAVAHATGAVAAFPALSALVGALLLQIASNLANDVFDAEKGADTEDRLGPTRAVQAGLLTAQQVRLGLGVTLALALLVGVHLTAVAGWPVIAIGVASMVSAVAYTGGPFPLGYHGLGDVFVLAFFGFVAVAGTVFVQTGAVPPMAWWAAWPVGALATCILVVNNVRDRATDVIAGKRTLAVRLGRRAGVAEYAVLTATSFAVPVVLWTTTPLTAWVLLPLVTAPLALRLTLSVARDEGGALNPTLVKTAAHLALFGLLFAAGIALAAP